MEQEVRHFTDQQSALALVAHSGFREVGGELLEAFYLQWQHEALVMNQWLAIQKLVI